MFPLRLQEPLKYYRLFCLKSSDTDDRVYKHEVHTDNHCMIIKTLLDLFAVQPVRQHFLNYIIEQQSEQPSINSDIWLKLFGLFFLFVSYFRF